MQLTTLIPATLIAFSGLAISAPDAIPVNELTWSTNALPVLDDNKGLASDRNDINGDNGFNDDFYIEKRGSWVRKVKFCEGANGQGTCNYKDFKPETGCYNVWGWMNDKISSIYLAPGTYCVLFADGGCRGKWLKAFDPGYSNLKTQSSLNDQVSSMRCVAR